MLLQQYFVGMLGIPRGCGFDCFEVDNLDMFLKPALDTNNVPCLVDINSTNKTVYYNLGTGEFGYEKLDGTKVNPV